MRAVLTVVDVPEPEAGPDQTVYAVSTAGMDYADTHHALSIN
jgi:NADPH:quinone reductase-like Zn-dependent oxidoreductase